jgi:parallel beta-helix repeat protein
MAEIHRALKEPRNHFKGKMLTIILTSALVISLITSFLIAPSPSEGNPPASNSPARITYTVHNAILINGNAQFNNTNFPNNGVVSGNGTVSNPYVIEGWDVDATSSHGIRLQNTNAYFIVRNCYVHDGWYNGWYGIYLSNCVNATIDGNNCTGDFEGIVISSTSDSIVSNNSCSYDEYDGMAITSSSGNTIVNNTCSCNPIYGIEVQVSNDNTFVNNTCSYNYDGGIALSSSSNDILRGNVMINDGITMGGSDLSDWNTHGIDTSNTVNGKPVCYLRNQSGMTVPDGYGQVILANCTGFIIENLNFSNASIGINIGFCSNGTIRNNSCNSNHLNGISLSSSDGNILDNNTCVSNYFAAIRLLDSSGNILRNNNCSKNAYDGIYLASGDHNNTLSWNLLSNNSRYGVRIGFGSDDNWIWNNTFIANNKAGSVYNASHIQAYDDGTDNRWNTSGSPHGYGNYWGDWTTPDADFDGIVDKTYNLTAGVGPMDHYPRTTPAPPIPEFSELIVPIVGLMLIALIVGRTRKKP